MKVSRYREICQPPNKAETDPWSEWHFLRPFSIYITILLYKLGVGANGATVIGLVFGIFSFLLMAQGSFEMLVVGMVCALCGFLFDCVDGELARLNKSDGHSLRGTYLDYLVGGLNDFLIMLGAAAFLAANEVLTPLFVFGLGCGVVFLEKVRSLYVISVAYRNCIARKLYLLNAGLPTNENQAHIAWKKMSTFNRLIREPFTTFWRVLFLSIGAVTSALLSDEMYFLSAFVLTCVLSAVLNSVGFYSDFFKDRVTQNCDAMINSLGHVQDQ